MQPPINILFGFAAFFIGVAGALYLLTSKYIGEASFIVLVVLSLFTALIIGFSDKIDHMKLTQFEVKFREIQKTEASVKEVASALLEYIDATTENMATDTLLNDKKVEDTRAKLEEVLR